MTDEGTGSQQLFPETESLTQCLNIHNITSLSHIRPYLDNEALSSALAATTYAFRQFRQGQTMFKSREMLVHHGKALSALQSQLNTSQIEEASMLAIVYLIMLEVQVSRFMVHKV